MKTASLLKSRYWKIKIKIAKPQGSTHMCNSKF